MSDATSVLVVDDDEAVGMSLSALLKQDGHKATWVSSAEAAVTTLEKKLFDLVITDVRMSGASGLELLRTVRQRWAGVPVILITAHGTVPMAVEAMRDGAADFMLKPFARDEVLFVVKKALSLSAADREAPPRAPRAKEETTDGMVGGSSALDEARQLIRKAAPVQAGVLILGEAGTGKELAARAIHHLSPRKAKAFVAVNCGAIPDTLFESELFGYEKGAFTGANARKPGRFELATGGTLFLDEVGELKPDAQVKLLRVLQNKEYQRVGGTETLTADVRVVAATNRSLQEMVKAGTFREDLYFRLNVIPITMPPLRDRPGDVELLARHFVATLGPQNGRPKAELAAGALSLIKGQRWPGNVRELQNFVERLVVLAPEGDVIGEEAVRVELSRAGLDARADVGPAPDSLPERRKDAERQAVEEALKKANGNRSQAARLLGVSRRTLYNKLEALGLDTSA